MIYIKAIHQEALGFYMFHCFNISKHISVSVLFFAIPFSCFVFLCWIFENNCPGGGVSARFFCPRGRGFAFPLCLGGGKFRPFKTIPRGLPGGGMVRLGID